MNRRFVFLAATLFCASALQFFVAHGKDGDKAHVTPAEAVTFTPLDRTKPGGPQISVVSGDLGADAPVTFFLKVTKISSGAHSHPAGYHAVIVRGESRHFVPGSEHTAQTLGPGSVLYEPAQRIHVDECLAEECLVLIISEGRFSTVPAPK